MKGDSQERVGRFPGQEPWGRNKSTSPFLPLWPLEKFVWQFIVCLRVFAFLRGSLVIWALTAHLGEIHPGRIRSNLTKSPSPSVWLWSLEKFIWHVIVFVSV
jgi:hypothetical protein